MAALFCEPPHGVQTRQRHSYPNIILEAFSAMAIVGMLVLPCGNLGMQQSRLAPAREGSTKGHVSLCKRSTRWHLSRAQGADVAKRSLSTFLDMQGFALKVETFNLQPCLEGRGNIWVF